MSLALVALFCIATLAPAPASASQNSLDTFLRECFLHVQPGQHWGGCNPMYLGLTPGLWAFTWEIKTHNVILEPSTAGIDISGRDGGVLSVRCSSSYVGNLWYFEVPPRPECASTTVVAHGGHTEIRFWGDPDWDCGDPAGCTYHLVLAGQVLLGVPCLQEVVYVCPPL